MTPDSVSDELRYRLLNHLAEHPNASQREVAAELGISLGKVNYCLNALIQKGWLKVQNFKKSENKTGYLYVLTPKGIEEKVNVTYQFLRRKMAEYDVLKEEIERLTVEVQQLEQRSD
jgi:EPS-associated MarR family transcriptional regulator